MVITVTERALNQLKTIDLLKGKYPRVDASVAGGGESVKFKLVVDEPRRNDFVVAHDGVEIRIDYFTGYYLKEKMQIDYKEETGFTVGESLASSVCALEIG